MAARESAPDAEDIWLNCGVCTNKLVPTPRAGTAAWRCPACGAVRVSLDDIGPTVR